MQQLELIYFPAIAEKTGETSHVRGVHVHTHKHSVHLSAGFVCLHAVGIHIFARLFVLSLSETEEETSWCPGVFFCPRVIKPISYGTMSIEHSRRR